MITFDTHIILSHIRHYTLYPWSIILYWKCAIQKKHFWTQGDSRFWIIIFAFIVIWWFWSWSWLWLNLCHYHNARATDMELPICYPTINLEFMDKYAQFPLYASSRLTLYIYDVFSSVANQLFYPLSITQSQVRKVCKLFSVENDWQYSILR